MSLLDCRADTAWVLQYSLRRDGANLQTLLSLCSTVDCRGKRARVLCYDYNDYKFKMYTWAFMTSQGLTELSFLHHILHSLITFAFYLLPYTVFPQLASLPSCRRCYPFFLRASYYLSSYLPPNLNSYLSSYHSSLSLIPCPPHPPFPYLPSPSHSPSSPPLRRAHRTQL